MSSIEKENEMQALSTPNKVIKSKTRSKEYKQDFYNKKILKEDAKIEDIPQIFRTADLYILALSNVRNLNEKRHIVKVMMQDAEEYRESGMENKAAVLENLRGLVFGKVTMQEELPEVEFEEEEDMDYEDFSQPVFVDGEEEELPHICHEKSVKEIKLSPFKLIAATGIVCAITAMVRR